MVKSDRPRTIRLVKMKNCGFNPILKAKSSSQFLRKIYATGQAMSEDMIKSFTVLKESKNIILQTVAPIVFRKPISFVRCTVVNEISPSRPRQTMKIEVW
jgi:hypothetical protein